MSMGRSDQYFAGRPTEEVGREIYERVQRYYRMIDQSGYFALLKKSHAQYYGMSMTEASTGLNFQAGFITRGGKSGERFNFRINQYRNLLQHLLVLMTSERSAFEAMAENTDSESQAQSILSEGLLENYQTEKRMERHAVRCAEYALYLSTGHSVLEWDVNAGRRYGVGPSGAPVFEGDLKMSAKTPLDVVVDSTSETPETRWKIVKRQDSKWDLIAQFPDLTDKLERISKESAQLDMYNFTVVSSEDSDLIPVWDFYHERTPALPDGRLVTVLPGGDVIYDGPLPYRKVPIYTLQPYNIQGTPYGYTPGFDILSIQDAVDILGSTILSNQIAFGTQLIGLPKGHDIGYQQIADGLAALEFDPKLGPPVPLQLTQTAPEIFSWINQLISFAEQLAGLNSVVRGNPQGQLQGASGAAMALLASQAIQFANGFQREWEFFNEDIGTGTIQVLQDYASTPRVAQITGKANRSYMKEFKGSDINRVTKVRVKRVSAIAKTTSGKMALADNLLQHGAVNPDQYLSMVKTGQLDTMTEAPMSQQLNIRAENERLRDGKMPSALITDKHSRHIPEHLSILDSPEARENPVIVQNALAHVQEHMNLWRQLAASNPELLMLMGEPMPQMGQPPMPGGPMPGGPAPGPGMPSPDQMQAAPGAEAMQGQMPSQPGLPTNPMTGETFQPVGADDVEFTGGPL
jgi:DNA-binding transcriptional regulator YdaS (Cro superfamily)